MNIQNLAGQLLGQYELQTLLGLGGMGVVYRGVQRNLERTVAIKVLSPSLASERGYLERFYQEAKVAAGLEHAHIGPVYDYGVQGEISYVVMRFLTGGTLADRMKQREQQSGPLPSVGEVSKVLVQLGSALDYAHARGVIHRDIKPSNIMFDDQGAAYLVDFGIAKLMESTTSLTASNTPIGTPAYMPPEQWRSEPLTPAADQYALAITAYHVLTDTLPFQTTTPYALLHAHLHEDPVPIYEKRPDLPLVLGDVLAKALAKTPADRYPSAGAFASAFQDVVSDQTGGATNFFTSPVKLRSMGRTGSLSGGGSGTGSRPITVPRSGPINLANATDDDLVTFHQPNPNRLRLAVVGTVIALLAVIAILIALSLSSKDGGTESGALGNPQTQTRVAAALSDFSTREAQRATDDLQTAEQRGRADGRATAEAEIATSLAMRDSTQTAEALIDQATAAFVAAATQGAVDATATQDAGDRRATFDAFNIAQTQSAQQQVEALRTQEAQQTRDAGDQQATQTAQVVTATAWFRATATQAAADMGATQVALYARSTVLALEATALDATDAAATQDAFSAQMTADARTATADALNAQATAGALDAAATQTAEGVNATATAQAGATAEALNATATQDARDQLTTQQVLGHTATADAQTATFIAQITDTPTVTPTPTPSATPTITPTSTPSPSPTPAARPDLRMVYEADRFVITNVSERTLDVSAIVLMSDANSDVQFPVELWAELSAGDPSHMGPGGCFYLTTGALEPADNPPAKSDCSDVLGYVQSPAPSRHFWLSDDPEGTFSLMQLVVDEVLGEEVARIPIYTCSTAASECTLTLPEPAACPGFGPSLLAVGDSARVIPRLTAIVYDEADDTSSAVTQITAENSLTILDGPTCADDTLWWQVDVDGVTGWTPEGRDSRYWLVPAG